MFSDTFDIEKYAVSLAAELDALLNTGGNQALPQVVERAAATAESVCRNRPMACAAGCTHCCVLNVAVLLPEALVIARYLREQLAAEELDHLKQRLSSHSNWVRWMDDEERMIRRELCPLLDESGNCSVHPVRPLACRGVASLDSRSCREAFNPVISDQDRMVPADLLRRTVHDETFRALAMALKARGLADKSIDLVDGIRVFLEQPDRQSDFLAIGPPGIL